MLTPKHRAFLSSQAVKVELAEKLGVCSLTSRADNEDLGEAFENWANFPAIAFPWTSPDGRVEWQIRPEEPTLDDKNRPRKYVYRSKGQGYRPVLWAVHEVESPAGLLIVEGTKQSLAAASYAPERVAVYGIGGCRMWQSEGLPIPDLRVVKGQRVVVVLDADAATNPQVYGAGMKLGKALKDNGALSVKFARLEGENPKDGLDDVLGRLNEDQRTAYLMGVVKAAGGTPAKVPPPGVASSPDSRALTVTRASDIAPRASRWLWAEDLNVDDFTATGARGGKWLPLGGLCLLAGREGIGKSTWAYKLAAEVTRGTLPGAYFGQPRSVVIVATEDDWAHTIVPRLLAAGAELSRVFRVDAVEDQVVTGLTLPADNARLEKVCQEHEVALILLDPLMGAISGKLDSHKDHDVRVALEPLSRLAHNGRLTVLGLIHVNKSQGSDLLSRIMASRAFSAVARAVLFCVADLPMPGEDSKPGQQSYFLGQAKSNLGPKVAHSIKYHIESANVGHDEELSESIWSSRIVVDGFTDQGIEAVDQDQEGRKTGGGQETALKRAVRWLKDYLEKRGGSAPSAEIKTAAVEAGHTWSTTKRAKDELDVGIDNNGVAGGGRNTLWSLPDLGLTGLSGLTELTGPTGPIAQTNTKGDKEVGQTSRTNQPKPPREMVRPLDPTGCVYHPNDPRDYCGVCNPNR